MADQQRIRPSGLIPSWANDALINDPGETWDATNLKIEPGGGKRDDGWVPNEQPSAQHTNHLKHEDKIWIQWIANLQAQNWSYPTRIEDQAGANGCDCRALTYDRATANLGVWLVGGFGETIFISPDGVGWAIARSAGPGNDFDIGFSKIPSDAPVTVGFFSVFGCTANNYMGTWSGAGAWTASALPLATNRPVEGVWAGGHGLVIAVGGDVPGNLPTIWSSAPVVPLVWAAALPAAVNSNWCVDVAHDPAAPLTVAIGDNVNGDVFWSADGLIWNTINPGINDMRAIAYNPEQGLWMITNATGQIWTSGNGTAWSLLTTPGFSPVLRSLCARGSHWFCHDVSTDWLYFSTDNGLIWRAIGDVWGQLSRGAPIVGHVFRRFAYSENLDQWALIFDGGPANQYGQFKKTLSLGAVLQTMSGGTIVEVTPTVT